MLASSAGRPLPSLKLLAGAAPLVNWTINVTNTGEMDADDVVLGFMTPPGAGENGVPLYKGFDVILDHVSRITQPCKRRAPYSTWSPCG